ncbi:MAG: hypothetical protein FWD78_13185 [Treponema sp.]|nr:hypothetical protein [Treponema sp.]
MNPVGSGPVKIADLSVSPKQTSNNILKELNQANAGKNLINKSIQPGLTAIPGAQTLVTATLAAGLPNDALGRAILVFSRIFNLIADPGLLTDLRKDILANGASNPSNIKEKSKLEAKVLAAMAALDKGVNLDRESLETYAAIPDDDNFPGDNNYGQNNHNFNKDKKEQLFGYLNRIPGKNNAQWIVWPFKYGSGGTELKVLVRILIKDKKKEGVIIADITGPKHKWRFFLNNYAKKTNADVSIIPGLSPKDIRSLRRDLSNGLITGDIRIHNGAELPLTELFAAEVLPSVNKEV